MCLPPHRSSANSSVCFSAEEETSLPSRPAEVFTFVRLSCQSLTYALCLEKLSLRPCGLLLIDLLYPVPLPLRQLLLLSPLSLRLLMPNLYCLMIT
jgi:hypothetical protein